MFDPFMIFDLPYEFDIPNLDELYYKKIKNNKHLEQLNLAYQYLMDPIKKLFFLCEKNGEIEVNKDILKKIFNSKNSINTSLELAINAAKKQNWKSCWDHLQTYQYMKKMHKKSTKN